MERIELVRFMHSHKILVPGYIYLQENFSFVRRRAPKLQLCPDPHPLHTTLEKFKFSKTCNNSPKQDMLYLLS